MRLRRLLAATLACCLLSLTTVPSALAWSNGDNSGNGYGTHDWILYEASRLASQRGYSWVDMRQAQPACDDPDTVLHDAYHHDYDIWGDTYGDAPTRIGELYNEAVAYRATGDFANASKTLGLLSHYYTDVCQPMHTDQTPAEDGIHSAYELAAQTKSDGLGENRWWVVNDGLQYTNGAGLAEDSAREAHTHYAPLLLAYKDKFWGLAVEANTAGQLNRASNGLADLIASIDAEAELQATSVNTDRWYGGTRYGTAVDVSQHTYSVATTVVVATGEGWADALAGAPLAAAYGGPLLLVQKNAVPAAVSAEITRLGATGVVVLGGATVVTEQVMADLRLLPNVTEVERISGWNRYATAQAIAQRIRLIDPTPTDEVFIATGADFPDALGASSIAAARQMPILLTTPSYIPTPTSAALTEFGADRAFVLGSSKVVSDDVVLKLRDRLAGATRLFGSDRYQTAGAVLTWARDSRGIPIESPALVNGVNFPDALAAGPALASRHRTMLLTGPIRLPVATGASMRQCNPVNTVTFIGSEFAISTFVNADLQRLFNPKAVPIPAYPVWSPPAPL